MTKTTKNVLVLGGTGKTGSRVASRLTELGLTARRAARGGPDVRFDWDDTTTHRPALDGVDRVYLVAPVQRVDFAPAVSSFLDLAETAGVRHVTYLSAYGVNHAPPEAAHRAVELDLMARSGFTYSILRPSWFMQNFSETFLRPVEDVLDMPTGDGTEAFVDAEDIAAVAAATLADPAAHAGAEYALTGPEAITLAGVAGIISGVTGRPMRHENNPDTWLARSGASAEYTEVLLFLAGNIASGRDARPCDDIQKVTGRPAGDFTAYARRTAHAWST
ncbi:NmrA family NAD(P)-binding protein [Sphaerisporangium aureirubrum]|uniref:NAD(P)H-binding protein n=1 Tax=Sphaerisporangium aureirubrum TaxID=1544736 RepID=A0ABW1ND87_9ACTN